MKIKDVDKVCIVGIAGKAILKSDLIKLKKLFRLKNASTRIGINLGNITATNTDFLELLKETSFERKISVFNVKHEIYLTLFISQYDRFVDIYINEDDFIKEKRCIVYRRLKLLKSA